MLTFLTKPNFTNLGIRDNGHNAHDCIGVSNEAAYRKRTKTPTTSCHGMNIHKTNLPGTEV
jgi:hypothetical protein